MPSQPRDVLVDHASMMLEKSPYVSSRDVRLESDQGRLILRGSVTTYYQKQMAQELVRGIDGVSAVENLLEVHWR